MRIISPFRDYYDCLSTNTQPVYIRESSEEIIRFPLPKVIWTRAIRTQFPSVFIHTVIFGFCGEIFSVYQDDEETFWDEEHIICDYPHLSEINLNFHKRYGLTYLGFELDPDFKKQFNFLFSPTSPIWSVDRLQTNLGYDYIRVKKNPMIKHLGFVNKYGVEQTFQKIEMYLGSLAFPDVGIPTISDEDLIAAKGFDKFSFRKDKQS